MAVMPDFLNEIAESLVTRDQAEHRIEQIVECMRLWLDFGDHPVNEDDCIELDWNGFELGTSKFLRRKFKGFSHKMTVWNIPDEYDYMDDLLIMRLRGKADAQFLPAFT
jgi:hypothetical protein